MAPKVLQQPKSWAVIQLVLSLAVMPLGAGLLFLFGAESIVAWVLFAALPLLRIHGVQLRQPVVHPLLRLLRQLPEPRLTIQRLLLLLRSQVAMLLHPLRQMLTLDVRSRLRVPPLDRPQLRRLPLIRRLPLVRRSSPLHRSRTLLLPRIRLLRTIGRLRHRLPALPVRLRSLLPILRRLLAILRCSLVILLRWHLAILLRRPLLMVLRRRLVIRGRSLVIRRRRLVPPTIPAMLLRPRDRANPHHPHHQGESKSATWS